MSKDTLIYAVGIDLGTTNSAIGVFQSDMIELIENKEGRGIGNWNDLTLTFRNTH